MKHEPVCKKLTNLQRKPFDSGKQRAAGSDVPYSDIKKAAKEKEKVAWGRITRKNSSRLEVVFPGLKLIGDSGTRTSSMPSLRRRRSVKLPKER